MVNFRSFPRWDNFFFFFAFLSTESWKRSVLYMELFFFSQEGIWGDPADKLDEIIFVRVAFQASVSIPFKTITEA